MKRFNLLAQLAALISITMVATGCPSKNNSNPPTPGAVPPGYSGGVGNPVPAGSATITFTGTNVYDDSVHINGSTPNFYSTSPSGTLVVNSGPATFGGAGAITGTSRYFPDSKISIITSPTGTGSYSTANIVSGVVTLGPSFIQANYPGGLPAVQGIAIDVYMSGAGIYSGTVWICTQRDSAGNCHGAYLPF